jgi:hypothetical protein
VFLAMAVLALLTLIAAWAMPAPRVEEPFRRRVVQAKAAE